MTVALDDYAEFLETIPDAALLVDRTGRIAYANGQAASLFGHDASALRGQPLALLLPESLRERHAAAVANFFDQPHQRSMGSGLKLAAQRRDGSAFIVDIMLKPVALRGGTMALSIVRDISARLQIEAELKAALERERELALTDHLTGVANSRHFTDLVEREIDRLRRYRHAFSLAYIDLDNFKRVNDDFGHRVGDELLRAMSQAMRQHLRTTDLLARLGGDEFGILLPETDAEGAQCTMNKMRSSVSQAMSAARWPVTLSIGLVTCRHPPADIDELIRHADTMMYRAKRLGKNTMRWDIVGQETEWHRLRAEHAPQRTHDGTRPV